MTRQEESLVLVPHALGYRPTNSIAVTALATVDENSERPHGAVGPVLVWNLDKGPVDSSAMNAITEFVVEFEVTDLAIDWFGPDLSEMIADAETIGLIHHAALEVQDLMDEMYRSLHVGFVSACLTDYRSWIAVNACPPGLDFNQVAALGLVGNFAELESGPLATELVFSGSAPLEERDIAPPVRVEAEKRRLALDEYRVWSERSDSRARQLWNTVLRRLGDHASYEPLTLATIGGSRRAGRLNASLADPLLRDTILVHALNPALQQIDWLKEDRVDDLLREACTVDPQRERISRVAALLTLLSQYGDDSDPTALAMLAYLHWWLDEPARSNHYANAALDADAVYPLANLVRHALDVGVRPPWQ